MTIFNRKFEAGTGARRRGYAEAQNCSSSKSNLNADFPQVIVVECGSERMNSMRWAARLLLPLLALIVAPFAYSAERPSVFLEDLTWTELRDQIAAGKTTIII